MMKFISFLVFSCTILSACIDQIPLNIEDKIIEKLVVNGSLHDLAEPRILRLHYTQGIENRPIPISSATILLFDDKGKSFQYGSGQEGTYILDGRFVAEVSRSYYISIQLANGKKYISTPEKMLPAIEPEALIWRLASKIKDLGDGDSKEIKGIALDISTGFNQDTSPARLKWEIESAYQFTTMPECNPFRNTYTCYFSNTLNPNLFVLFSNSGTSLQRIKDYEISFEAIDFDYEFTEIHYYSVYQNTISESAFQYFQNLNDINLLNGTIFDPIAATVKGNITNIDDPQESVLGYFYVASKRAIRTKIVAADFEGKYPLLSKNGNICSWLMGVGNYFGPCCDCALPDPIIFKPSWW